MNQQELEQVLELEDRQLNAILRAFFLTVLAVVTLIVTTNWVAAILGGLIIAINVREVVELQRRVVVLDGRNEQ